MSIPESWYDDPVKPDWATRGEGISLRSRAQVEGDAHRARERRGNRCPPKTGRGVRGTEARNPSVRRELDELRRQVQAQEAAAGG